MRLHISAEMGSGRPERRHLFIGGGTSHRGSGLHRTFVCAFLWTCVFATAPPQRNDAVGSFGGGRHDRFAAVTDRRQHRAHAQRDNTLGVDRTRRQDNSCEARGCCSFIFTAPCNCDVDCALYTDCCDDYVSTCETTVSEITTVATTTEDTASLSKNSCVGKFSEPFYILPFFSILKQDGSVFSLPFFFFFFEGGG